MRKRTLVIAFYMFSLLPLLMVSMGANFFKGDEYIIIGPLVYSLLLMFCSFILLLLVNTVIAQINKKKIVTMPSFKSVFILYAVMIALILITLIIVIFVLPALR